MTKLSLCASIALFLAGCSGSTADDDAPGTADSDVTGTSACQGLTTESVAAGAHAFMEKAGLVRQGEEQTFEGLDISMKWKPVGLFPQKDACLVAMNLVTTTEGHEDLGDSHEVIAVKRGHAGEALAFSKFEDAVKVPAEVRAIIGEPNQGKAGTWGDADYYAVFAGDSAIAIMKDALTKRGYYGFSGVAVKGKKLELDRTPNRNWQITNAKFDLRRGMTAEVLDMYAKQLDGDFDGYFSGGVHTETPLGVGVNVAPWNCAIREVLP